MAEITSGAAKQYLDEQAKDYLVDQAIRRMQGLKGLMDLKPGDIKKLYHLSIHREIPEMPVSTYTLFLEDGYRHFDNEKEAIGIRTLYGL